MPPIGPDSSIAEPLADSHAVAREELARRQRPFAFRLDLKDAEGRAVTGRDGQIIAVRLENDARKGAGRKTGPSRSGDLCPKNHIPSAAEKRVRVRPWM
jgi:hypothetical protein